LTEGLVALGYACDYLPNISPEETFGMIAGYEGLIINSKILVDRRFLDQAVKLRFVGRLGSGMEIVDQVYAAQKGVVVLSSPEGNRNAVAEQALGMLLALSNNLIRGDKEVRCNVWARESNRGFELKGRTLGIVGFGHTGSQLARKLQGMEMRVLAYDRYKPSGYAAAMSWVEEVGIEHLQESADIISLHLPLTAETKHLIDHSFLQRCKKGLILINTSRGKCVNTVDLVAALESGTMAGACLDVFENEKPATFTEEEHRIYDRLHALENVVFSPHVAGWTHESKRQLAAILLEKISLNQ
jgi:D-3-phosphoglycerate dehydrogenase